MQAEAPRSQTTLERLSPDDLMTSFSKSHLIRWLLVALGLHVVVIAGFSVGTIRDLIDPEGAKARRDARTAAAMAASAPAPSPAPSAAPASAEAAVSGEPAAGAAGLSPVERATSEVAKPDEIPSVPDDLGLSIEDTNLQ